MCLSASRINTKLFILWKKIIRKKTVTIWKPVIKEDSSDHLVTFYQYTIIPSSGTLISDREYQKIGYDCRDTGRWEIDINRGIHGFLNFCDAKRNRNRNANSGLSVAIVKFTVELKDIVAIGKFGCYDGDPSLVAMQAEVDPESYQAAIKQLLK